MAAGLKRTTSYITLPGLVEREPQPPVPQPPSCAAEEEPYIRTLQFFKERRERRKARRSLKVNTTPTPISTAPPPPPAPPLPSRKPSLLSPLPRCSSTAATGAQPRRRSKNVEPDLYRIAITACMRTSEHGQRILKLGARVAVLQATIELEAIVHDRDGDVLMHGVSYWDDSY